MYGDEPQAILLWKQRPPRLRIRFGEREASSTPFFVNLRYVVLHKPVVMLWTPGSYPDADSQLHRLAILFGRRDTGLEPAPSGRTIGQYAVHLHHRD